MFFYFPILVLLISIARALPPISNLSPPPVALRDRTSIFGIRQPVSEYFGGATVADLNRDGYPDLILTYHNKNATEVYYGTGKGNFRKTTLRLFGDIHGISVAPRNAKSNDMLISVSLGGGRGANLRPPTMVLVKNENAEIVTTKLGFGPGKGRGRLPIFGDWKRRAKGESRWNDGGPDIVLINMLSGDSSLKQFAYENSKSGFIFRNIRGGLESVDEERAIVTDVDNDGIMEIVHFSVLHIYRLTKPFTFVDFTKNLWPGWRNLQRSIAAVAELDYDNDGRMDLYLARCASSIVTPRGPASVREHGDVLLRNVGGKYVDVTQQVGLGGMTGNSIAVSVGDADNDGWIDIYISLYKQEDIWLMNKGGNGFEPRRTGMAKMTGRVGGSALVADIDLDGDVDVIVGQGWRKKYKGNYRFYRNELNRSGTNYLLVRVGNELSQACTALHAIVTVTLPNKKMIRRVGGRGTALGGESFIDTVHFGMGKAWTATKVSVKWACGGSQEKYNVMANSRIVMGRFP